MKNFYKLAVLLLFFLNLQIVNAQNANNKGFELMGKNPETIQLNQAFTKNIEAFPFEGKASTIYGLALKANMTLNNEKSFIRVILLDKQGNEYLVYEAYPLLEEGTTLSIDNLCEETGILNGVRPQSIKIELKDASLTIVSLTYSASAEPGVDLEKVKKDKKNLQNSQKINQINKSIKAKGLAWVAGETEVSALTYEQKKKLYGQSTFPSGIEYYVGGVLSAGDGLTLKSASTTSMVDNWDWRDRHGKNWITEVKNQGSCGSCWAFAATGATEAQVNLFYNQPLNMNLSEQNLLSCSGAGSCSGGYPSIALDYIKNTGIIDEAAFPYTATDQVCTNKSSSPADQIKIGGRIDFGSTAYPVSEDNLKRLLIKYGPVSGGLLDWSHAMTLVGWKTVKDGDSFLCRDPSGALYYYPSPYGTSLTGKIVWIFKNSWGATWGAAGYVYVETSISNFAWTHALVAPVQSLKQSYTVQCVDNDHDGYYWWGLGAKPANCPPCPAAEDGDDADATLGPLDSYGNCIPITNAPVADFKANTLAIAVNGSASFADLSTNSPTTWSWTFDGGTPATSTLQNPVVTYTAAGVYSVTLKATNAFGDGVLTKTSYITVSAPLLPVADFVSDKTVVLEGQGINMTDLSSNNPVSWSWSFSGGTPSSSTLKNPAVTYKTAGKYDVTLVVTNADGKSTKIKTGYINVNAIVPTYVNSHGNASKEWISQVSMNGSSYTSASTGSVGYANLTANVFNAIANSTYSIGLTPKYSGKANYWYWSVWIDFNHDFDFDDAGEQVLIISKSKTAVAKSITIPSTALAGSTRMRVSMKRDALPFSNEVFAYGEVKDFTVNISVPGSGDNQLKNASIEMPSVLNSGLSLTVFPNPTEKIVNLKLDEIFGNEVYSIYSMNGSVVKNEQIDSNITQIDLSGLPAGIYVVKVKTGEQTLQGKFIKR